MEASLSGLDNHHCYSISCKKRLNISLKQLLKLSSGKKLISPFSPPARHWKHPMIIAITTVFLGMWKNVRDPELYFDLTSQITLLVLHQADCGVFVLGLLLVFFTCYSFTNNLSLGEFQSVSLFVKDNTVTLEQEWSSSILSCCYTWRNICHPSSSLQLSRKEGPKVESSVHFHLRR